MVINGPNYLELYQACFGVVETVLDADNEGGE